MKEELLKKLLNENHLHDSCLTGIKLNKDIFELEFDCEGMGLSYYDKNIKNAYINIKLKDIRKLNFDFSEGSLIVLDCSIKEKNELITLSINEQEVYVEAKKMTCDIRIVSNNFKSNML